VTDSKVSAEYLEQMGSFIAWLILDVSPSSIEWKKDILLTYVTPDKFGAFKTRLDLESERLKRINASTYFMPQQLVPTEETQSVVVRGRLRTQINGQDTTTESKVYRIQFQYAGGRVHLEIFEEIANDQKTTTDNGIHAN
jgi:conjugal transfer pilus assembly protein TraE